jgi:hypothetical protein
LTFAAGGGITVVYLNAKQWLTALDRAALEIVAANPDRLTPGESPLQADPCGQHGSACVRIVFGELLVHVAWKEHDPSLVAATLVDTMLGDASHTDKALLDPEMC